MKITYDKEADAMYIYLSQGKVFKTKKIKDGLIADFDKKGNIRGIEILFASKHIPKKLIESSIKLPNRFKTVTV